MMDMDLYLRLSLLVGVDHGGGVDQDRYMEMCPRLSLLSQNAF